MNHNLWASMIGAEARFKLTGSHDDAMSLEYIEGRYYDEEDKARKQCDALPEGHLKDFACVVADDTCRDIGVPRQNMLSWFLYALETFEMLSEQ